MASSAAPTTTATTTLTPTAPSSPTRTLRIGTRASALALAQTHLFTTLLTTHSPTTLHSIHPSTTVGDKNQLSDLHSLAQQGKSLWTHELEAQLQGDDTHAPEIDCIVHSLKDVPTKLPAGCKVVVVGRREGQEDCVVFPAGRHEGKTGLSDLSKGSVVGTSSVRRAAMVRRRFPGLLIKDVRGSIGTRLRKLDTEADGYDCIILAGAGILRLGLDARIASWVGREQGMLRAVGQGAVGVEVREGDEWVAERVFGKGMQVRRVMWECVAERSLLRTVEGGCSVPVGVETVWEDDDAAAAASSLNPPPSIQDTTDPGAGFLHLSGMVVSLDGKECVEGSRRQWVGSEAEAEECGWELARVLVERGAGKILDGIGLNRGVIEGQGGA